MNFNSKIQKSEPQLVSIVQLNKLSTSDTNELMNHIVKSLKNIEKLLAVEQESEQELKWKYAAIVIDR